MKIAAILLALVMTACADGNAPYHGVGSLDAWMYYQQSGAQYSRNEPEPNLSRAVQEIWTLMRP